MNGKFRKLYEEKLSPNGILCNRMSKCFINRLSRNFYLYSIIQEESQKFWIKNFKITTLVIKLEWTPNFEKKKSHQLLLELFLSAVNSRFVSIWFFHKLFCSLNDAFLSVTDFFTFLFHKTMCCVLSIYVFSIYCVICYNVLHNDCITQQQKNVV